MALEATSFKHQLSLVGDGAPLFVTPYQLEVEGRTVFADAVTIDGNRVQAKFGGSEINDMYTFEPGLITVRRAWSLDGYFDARLEFGVLRKCAPRLLVVPGAVYRGLRKGEECACEMPENLCAVPSFLFLEDEDMYFAVFTQPGAGAGEMSGVSAQTGGPFAEVKILIPGSDDGGKQQDKFVPAISVKGHLSWERTFYIVYGKSGHGALRQAIGQAWDLLAFEPSPPSDWSPAAGGLVNTLIDHFFVERGDAIGFVKAVNPGMFPVRASIDGGGMGGNLAAARALYRDSLDTGNHDLKRRALDIADFYLNGAENHDAVCAEYRLGARSWRAPSREPAVSRSLGHMFYEYLMLHRDTRRNSDHNPRWLRACRRWADLLVAQVKPGSAPGTDVSRGHGPDEKFEGGPIAAAYRIWVLAALSKYFPGAGYRVGAERLAAPLLPLSAENAWGRPEGPPGRDDALAMLRAFMLLHTLTGHREYLTAAGNMGALLMSCTYCCNAHVPERSPMGRLGFHTCGGVINIPGRGALDTNTATVALELLRLEALGGGSWKRTALAQLEFTARLISTDYAPLFQLPGCPPATLSVPDGTAAGLESRSVVTALSAIVDLAEEFPEFVKLHFPQHERYRSIKKTFGRMALYTGCLVNRWS